MSVQTPRPAPLADYGMLGPIGPLVADPLVTEVMVMGADAVYVEIHGHIVLTNIRFASTEELMHMIRFIVESVGRRIDDESPLCDARLADGSRVHAVIPPIAVDGPMLTIRKFAHDPYTEADLIALGSCTAAGFAFLRSCVLARANILISGGTGTGKTTLLNLLSGYIPSDARIVTIEDAAELQLRQGHVARLESRPPDADGRKQVTIRDLVITSLRMRPDRIVVGEVRGPEALDMLQAMNTGHEGSMTTVHANKSRDALSRIETMVLMAGIELPIKAIRQQVASAFNILVHLDRLRDGTRRVVEISEITGMEDDTISTQGVFRFASAGATASGSVQGHFEPSGLRPRILDRLPVMGLPTPPELAGLFPGLGPAGRPPLA
ncbi:MAG: CpaF family protein [Chloroflexi bacterium]|nr:MAG: CpaF family protein [Chloroflexota bacterium]TMD52557.1 MAG: CpaF family protein [Chloroflexota bacterium]